MNKYFLSIANVEVEVTKEQFVQAERAAGFRNTMGQPLEPATAGFHSGVVSGRVDYVRGNSS